MAEPTPEHLYRRGFTCESYASPRLDAFLAKRLPQMSRSYIKDLIGAGLVQVDGAAAKPSTKLGVGAKVVIEVPQPKDASAKAEDIPLTIKYQDEHLAVVVKPRGMLSHPAPGKYHGTLVNALLHHIKDLSGINGELRPGIVHRLDRDTSGIMVVAKHDEAHRRLQNLFRDRDLTKRYLALVSGRLAQPRGLVDIPIGRHKHKRYQMAAVATGKEARSEFQVLRTYGDSTLVVVRILTGRTHQIRVHMSHIGHPVVGDQMYGNRKDGRFPGGFALHAWNLAFEHPFTQEAMRFYHPLPADFRECLGRLWQEEKDGYL